MWYAKPSGAYAIESNEGKEKIVKVHVEAIKKYMK